jgi:hypothetical protein
MTVVIPLGAEQVLVQLSDVQAGGPVADEPAPRRVENGRFACRKNGRQRDVGVRLSTHAPKRSLRVDDVALKRRAASGVIVP